MNTRTKEMKKLYAFILLFSMLSTHFPAKAEVLNHEENMPLLEKFGHNVGKTWQNGEYNLFIPINTWHNRLAYDQDKIDEYNEMPGGIGLGKARYDEDGDWHALYAMVFDDSNYHPQTIFGYAFQKNWFVNCNPDFRVGVGFTVSLTQRHEYLYIPVPLPLPLAGVEYKDWAVQAAYVPGVKNDGNVLFTWLRYRF